MKARGRLEITISELFELAELADAEDTTLFPPPRAQREIEIYSRDGGDQPVLRPLPESTVIVVTWKSWRAKGDEPPEGSEP